MSRPHDRGSLNAERKRGLGSSSFFGRQPVPKCIALPYLSLPRLAAEIGTNLGFKPLLVSLVHKVLMARCLRMVQGLNFTRGMACKDL